MNSWSSDKYPSNKLCYNGNWSVHKMNDYYISHKIKVDDTINNIAIRYNSSISSILTANPQINPFFLEEGALLIVPTSSTIVTTESPYDYKTFKYHLMIMKAMYPFLDVNLIGASVAQREIYSVTFGKGEHTVVYNAAHHGNEWITSMVLMKWLESLCYAHSLKGSIRGFSIDELFENNRIILVPMVNPDGVDLCIHGTNSIGRNKERLLYLNGNNPDFSGWKANLNGIDLNRNYDAGWSLYKKMEPSLNIHGPGPYGFAGFSPHSEPESMCLTHLTLKENPRLILAYHSQGEEIFWQFGNRTTSEAGAIANELSRACGYKLSNEAQDQSFAGYKDWFVHKFSKPGFTIEVGSGVNPLPIECLDEIYERNEELLLLASVI